MSETKQGYDIEAAFKARGAALLEARSYILRKCDTFSDGGDAEDVLNVIDAALAHAETGEAK